MRKRLQFVWIYSDADWVPIWLGLQASNLGQALAFRRKEALSKVEMDVVAKYESVLDGNVVRLRQ